MNKRSQNIIEKQFVEVEMKDSTDAFNFRNDLTEVCKNKLLAEIEKLFDKKIPKNKIVRIKKLEIDAGVISKENWKKEFVERTLRKLDEYLERIPSYTILQTGEPVALVIEESQKASETILYFLETGALPWHANVQNSLELQENLKIILNEKNFTSKLSGLIQTNQNALRRLINQFDTEYLDMFLKSLLSEYTAPEIISKWMKDLKNLYGKNEKRKEVIYRSAFDTTFNKESEEAFLKTVSEKISNLTNEKPEGESKLKNVEQIQDGWYVKNSGLVILHPFLLSLFENTGYIENKKWLSEEVQQRAIALTQFLVTGSEEYPEFDLILNKIICGYDIEKTLPADIQLSDYEKHEANDLLRSVINHWSALKNTTITGLQETFFMREGKLTFNNNEWLLQVEEKTVDILLNKLPWGISMIQLPWMEVMLKTEWNY